jgi:GNAT superfamily N-acetyltransferase
MTVLRRATTTDRDGLMTMIGEFYEIDRHPFDREQVRAGLDPLLVDDRYGQVWIICSETSPIAGYAVVTWSWSLESGGRDCILDELYVRERLHGLGTRALGDIVTAARAAGARMMFLETEAHHGRVRSFYRRCGFEVEDSVWMARHLDR